MEKRKLLLYLPLGIILLLTAVWLWPESEEDKKIKALKAQAVRAAQAANPASGEYRQFAEESKSLFTEDNMYTYAQLVEMARTGRISLIAELWKLRHKCDSRGQNETGKEQTAEATPAPKMNLDECNLRIEAFIREQYPAPENEKLLKLFRDYLRYEETMRRFVLPDNLTVEERQQQIKKKRREIFSESDAQLVFGYEEARTETQEALGEFVKNSAAMPAADRVQKYFDLRKKSLGDYNAAYNESEPAYTRYETELMLRGDEMQRKNSAAADTQGMREKYFGREAAKRMAQVDKEVQQERQRIENFEAAAQKFVQQNASLSEAERKAKLAELRVSMLGKEEAEAYERRMQYEEYLRANNLK